MNARTKIHQLHLNEWITRFSEQKASGLTVKQWCEQNHLSVHAYNYWKHLVKEDLSRQVLPDIVPLAFPVSTTYRLTMLPNNSFVQNRELYSLFPTPLSKCCAQLSKAPLLPFCSLQSSTRHFSFYKYLYLLLSYNDMCSVLFMGNFTVLFPTPIRHKTTFLL